MHKRKVKISLVRDRLKCPESQLDHCTSAIAQISQLTPGAVASTKMVT